VNFVAINLSVRKIGYGAFAWCKNLVKVTAPFVEEVGELTFCGSFNLHHATLSPDAVIKPGAFKVCFSFEVLAASVGFELDTGDKAYGGSKRANGDVCDWHRYYGELAIVYGRIVDGVGVPVEEGSFMNWG